MADGVKCPYCGAELEPGLQFCPACNAPLSSIMGDPFHQTAGSGAFDLFICDLERKLNIYIKCTAIYGIVALVYGLIVVFATDYYVEVYRHFNGETVSANLPVLLGLICIMSSL